MHGGWCWELVAPLLKAAGYQVDAPDLPGCGEDPTPPQNVTFADYVRRIAETVRGRPGPVLLVGHSMAGGAISRAAEEAADQVAVLVYLTAMLPKDGEMLGTMAHFGEDSVMRGVRPGDIPGTTAYDRTLASEIFYNTTSSAMADAAVARLARLAPV